ncbi:uncharacterized protein LOC119073338 [Bradysia coprophila]|uniref:uncharacterized protein LOC119073338 n=1 Tax=Bradysia coprophila TaxID=38358 RepID=UPI00187D9B09|nr:uncharacterized protein LOC119073338 [Bradysia coprophila]
MSTNNSEERIVSDTVFTKFICSLNIIKIYHFPFSTSSYFKMNSKVLNILILLAMNFCCAHSDIVSIVQSSVSTISNWYDRYIKPLWTWTTLTTPSSVPPDGDISFYEHEEDIEYSPSIRDENVVLMDVNEDQYRHFELENTETYTYLSNYDENFYDQMRESNNMIDSNNLGILRKFLQLIGYTPSTSLDDQITLRPHPVSNQTDGLDVRLTLLFKNHGENKLVVSREKQLKLILPGTLWCGDGNVAKSDQDLGLFHKTDKCCKFHDWCPKYIETGQSFMNLENIGVFTRSHCECDTAFYKCLKRADSIISNKIGETYFNVLKPQCFRKEYPIVGCIKKRRDDRCVNYVVDDSAQKRWQWFDNKKY